MRIAIAIVLALGLLAISPMVLAEDGANVPDMVADVLSGRQDNCLTLMSVAVCKELPTKVIPGLNLIPMVNTGRTQIGIKGLTPMGENFAKEGEFEIETRIIF